MSAKSDQTAAMLECPFKVGDRVRTKRTRPRQRRRYGTVSQVWIDEPGRNYRRGVTVFVEWDRGNCFGVALEYALQQWEFYR